MTEQQSRAHVERFNAGVTSGDWSAFLAGFTADAVMTFEGPPVGPFVGRDAIAQGYAAQPPDDTMEITSVRSAGDTERVAFRWSAGGTGTMTIRRRGELIAGLTVTFD
jgi:hypothetical protein